MIHEFLKIPVVALLFAVGVSPATAKPSSATSDPLVSECRTCHTVKVDDLVRGHYFNGAARALEAEADNLSPAADSHEETFPVAASRSYGDDSEAGMFRCEDCHTDEEAHACSYEHTQHGCGGDSEIALAALYKALDNKDIGALQRLVSGKYGFVINHARQSLQILDCGRDHTIASLSLSPELMNAVESY